MNLWRDILAAYNPPNTVNVVIEVISGSRDKYEYKIDWKALRPRPRTLLICGLSGGIRLHPSNIVRRQRPLDIMVLSYEPLEGGCLIEAKIIGALNMEDEEGKDPKILSVPANNPRFDGFKDLLDVHPHRLREIQEFFEVYKLLEPKKWVKFKIWRNAEEARKIINYAMSLYRQKQSSRTAT